MVCEDDGDKDATTADDDWATDEAFPFTVVTIGDFQEGGRCAFAASGRGAFLLSSAGGTAPPPINSIVSAPDTPLRGEKDHGDRMREENGAKKSG